MNMCTHHRNKLEQSDTLWTLWKKTNQTHSRTETVCLLLHYVNVGAQLTQSGNVFQQLRPQNKTQQQEERKPELEDVRAVEGFIDKE